MEINEFRIIPIFIILSLVGIALFEYFLLRPFYLYLSSKADKPFYNGKNLPSFAIKRGKYFLLNLFLDICVIFFIMEIPNLIYPSILYQLATLAIIWTIFPMIFIMHRKVFHDPKIVKVSETQVKIVNFRPGGYPSSYYCILTLFLMISCYYFGVVQYILTLNSKFLLVILVTFVVEVTVIFIDYTDKIFPVNLQTYDGFWVYTLFTMLIVCGVGCRVMGVHL